LKAKGRNEQAAHKKKTMKTTSNKSLKAQSQTEQSRTAQTPVATAPIQLPLPRISIRERRTNQALPTAEVLTLLQTEAPRFWELAEVVGKWVWIQFSEKQPREVTAALSQFGFHWNRNRQLWQHPCGTLKPFDPRLEFGSYFPADQKAA
jgi:hypothetical protein